MPDEITTSIRDAALEPETAPEPETESDEIKLPPEQTELPLPEVDAPAEAPAEAPKPSEDPKSEEASDLHGAGDDGEGDDHDQTVDVDAAHAEALLEDAQRDEAKASEAEAPAEASPEAPTEEAKPEAEVPLYDGVHEGATGLTGALGEDKTGGLKDAAAVIHDVRDEMIGLDRSELDAEAQAVLSFFVNQSAAFLAAIESIFKRNR